MYERAATKVAAALVGLWLGVGCAGRTARRPPAQAPEGRKLPPLTALGDLGIPGLPLEAEHRRARSGLRLVHQSLPGSGVVAAVVVVGAGGARDPEGQEGLAHLVEHLTFRARPASEETLWNRLRTLGATAVNGFTDHDQTVYLSLGPKGSLAPLLALEAQRLARPLEGVDGRTFELERQIVRNELRERDELGRHAPIFGRISAALFPGGHAYARPVGGTHESLARVSLADAQAFADRHYRAENATITLVGDFSVDELKRAVADAVPRALMTAGGAPPALPAVANAPVEPPTPPPGELARARGSVATPELWLAWSLPSGYGPYAGLGEVLERLLNARASALRARRPELLEVDWQLQRGVLADRLLARLVLANAEKPEPLVAQAHAFLADAWRRLEGGEAGAALELGATVISASSQLLLGTEDLLGRAVRLGQYAQLAGDPRAFPGYLERITAVDATRLRFFGATYVTPARGRALLVEPQERGTTSAPTGIGVPHEAERRAAAPRPRGGSVAAIVARTGAAEARTFVLPNGMKTILLRRPGFPVVAAALGFRGGAAHADPPGAELLFGSPHLAPAVTYCAGAPSFRGIQIAPRAGQDLVSIWGRAGGANLSPLLAALAERAAIHRHERWDALRTLAQVGRGCAGTALEPTSTLLTAARGAMVSLDLPRQRAEEADPRQRASRALFEALWAGTPHARPLSAVDPSKLEISAVSGWLDRVVTPENAFLVLVGDWGEANAEELVSSWFCSWTGSAPPPEAPRSPTELPRPGARLLVTERPGAGLVDVSLGCVLPGGDERRSLTHDLLAEYVSRRLGDRLRQSMGVTYGVTGSAWDFSSGLSTFLLGAALDGAQLEPALRTWRQIFGELDHGDVDEALLEEVRWDLARARNADLGAATILDRVVRLERLGRPTSEADRFGERLAAVSAEDLRGAFAACRERMVLSATGAAGALRAPGLAALVGPADRTAAGGAR